MSLHIDKCSQMISSSDSQRIHEQVKKETCRREHSQMGMFVLVLMSHGGQRDVILGSDGKPVDLIDLNHLISAKNFPAMKGKPKLVIVQACSGGESTLEVEKLRFVLCKYDNRDNYNLPTPSPVF